MPRYSSCLYVALFSGVLLMSSAHSAETAGNARTEPDVSYGRSYLDSGETIDRLMTVYMPPDPDASNRAAIIYLHGNPGNSPYPGGRHKAMKSYAQYFAKEGYVYCVVSWDLQRPFVQTKMAVRHLRANAEGYGIDPDRIAVHGSSYGGSWAMALAATDDDLGALNEEERRDSLNNWGVSARIQAAVATPGGIFWGNELDESDAPILYLRGTLDPNWYDEPNGFVKQLQMGKAPHAWFPVANAGHAIPSTAIAAFGKSYGEILRQWLSEVLLNSKDSDMALLHVVQEGPGMVDKDPINGFYPKGHVVTLSAKPNDGATFVRWEGGAEGDAAEITVTMDESKKVRAIFQKVPAHSRSEDDALGVAELLEDFRKILVGYNLEFDSIMPGSRLLTSFDATRLEDYPGRDDWPDVLGHVDTNPELFRSIEEDSKSKKMTISGPLAFMIPPESDLTTPGYATVLFLEGISAHANLVCSSYTSLVSHGQMAGKLFFDSYATAYIRGDVPGQITGRSYVILFVTGELTGKIRTESYAMIYLLGGFSGELELMTGVPKTKIGGSKVYIAGKTTEADLKRIDGMGKIYLEESDLPPGEHRIGDLIVTVGRLSSDATG